VFSLAMAKSAALFFLSLSSGNIIVKSHRLTYVFGSVDDS